jgi:hypothetical protein
MIRPTPDSAARALMLALALALPATASRAQTPAHAADVATEIDSASLVALRRIVDGAVRRGLPDEPLLAKAREGRLKRASGSRIATAVGALAARLDSARAALGARSTVDELVAGADALAAGAAPSSLRTVRDATTARPISVPLGVLAQLVASGVPPGRAVTLVVELLRRNVPPAQVLAYGNAVERDAASGMPAEESALFRLRSFGNGGLTDATLTDPTVGGAQVGGPVPPPPPSAAPRRRP